MSCCVRQVALLKFGLGLLDADYHTISREPNGPYTRSLLRTISLGRLKKDLPELLALLPTRNLEVRSSCCVYVLLTRLRCRTSASLLSGLRIRTP